MPGILQVSDDGGFVHDQPFILPATNAVDVIQGPHVDNAASNKFNMLFLLVFGAYNWLAGINHVPPYFHKHFVRGGEIGHRIAGQGTVIFAVRFQQQIYGQDGLTEPASAAGYVKPFCLVF